MRQPITPELLAQLRSDHPEDRLEHLAHPDEPTYEVVIRMPHLDEFKKWKRDNEDSRVDASERLMAVCLIYPSEEEWEAMLDERPALADTFAGDIPRLVGATPRSCVTDDPAVLAPYEEELGKGNVQHLRHPEYKDCAIIIRRPKRDAYKRFKTLVNNKARRTEATSTLVVDCLVSPSVDEWKLMLQRMPGLMDTFGDAAAKFAGASGDFTAKK